MNHPAPGPESDFSLIGRKLAGPSGILELMDDLGQALTLHPDMRMLGGGNPAVVPEFMALVRRRWEELGRQPGGLESLLTNYDPPQGHPRFLRAFAGLLQDAFGWPIKPENVAVTTGGQCACFFLFNLLAGRYADGSRRKILLPLAPEYLGYADQGLDADLFVSCPPRIEWPHGPEGKVFKYRIDFAAVSDRLRRGDIGALAVSRPTNPSGNALADEEIRQLSALAAEHGLPLIIDQAYGAPFPGILYVPVQPYWAPHVILVFSLSKLGLPATRTGIVVAPEPVAAALGAMTAVAGLANPNLGQHLVLPWLEDGSLLRLGPEILRPFYDARRRHAAQWLRECFSSTGVRWAMHEDEGTFFHWLWLPELRVTSRELFRRLKARKVLTVPGEYFFYGLEADWPHRHQCLRLNYSGPAPVVREALEILADEARRWQR